MEIVEDFACEAKFLNFSIHHFFSIFSFFTFSFFSFISFIFCFIFSLFLSFSFLGSSKSVFFFGLNCFKISCNISFKNFEPSRGVPPHPFESSFPFFLLFSRFSFLFLSFILQFFKFFSFLAKCVSSFFLLLFFFLIMSLVACVLGFKKRCFLRSRCSMEMWCPDDIGRES